MSGLLARSAALVCAVMLSVTVLPAAAQQRLLPAQSEIAFTIRQSGVPVEGRFRRFDGELNFDPKKPENADIALAIDLLSASIGSAETEAELARPEWFDTRSFARATFRSRAVRALGNGRFEVTGRLTLKGVSRDIVIAFTLAQGTAVPAATASGSFTLRRLDFRIGEGDWKDTSLVADEVQVRFRLAVEGLPRP